MTSSKRRKTAALALAFVGVAGLSIASAAQLSLGTGSLGAGTTVVESCQISGPIEVGFANEFVDGTTALPGEYETTTVVLNGVDETCVGKNYKVTLTDEDGAAIGDVVPAEIGAAGTVTIPLVSPVSAQAVTGVAVVIYS